MGQFVNRNGWGFHKHIERAYGSVVKINGYFGVNQFHDGHDEYCYWLNGQDKQLYVFDPKALHHIVVKDQYIYEETKVFIS